MRRIAICFAVLAALSVDMALPVKAAEKPNIVYVLCDDLGYGDLKCLNPEGKIATPSFDKIAAAGMAFTDAHSGSAVCSPTRYGIMTGRYAWRTKLQSGVLGGLSPRLIDPLRMTVAKFLKRHGYDTGAVGKWHLGMDWVKQPGGTVSELNIETPEQVRSVDYGAPIAGGPTTLGFDYYFGISASLDMVPYTFIENDHVTVVPTIDRQFPLMLGRPGGLTRLGPAAPQFDANQVLPELAKKAVQYITEHAPTAQKGQPFFLYLPLASPHTPIVPTEPWLGKSGLNPYADFVMQTDAALADVMAALDKNGLTENTLLIVTSDNGCSPQAKFEELLPKGHNPNFVFRGNKADIYEGGHRIPFLVRWPGHVPAGTRSDQTTCLTDFMATVADILQVKLTPDAGEDSVSMLTAMLGKATRPIREATVHHSINGSFAIRQANWKLCFCPGSGGWSSPRPGQDDTTGLPRVQLFDLASDIGEHNNLAAAKPDIVEQLTQLMDQYVATGRSTQGLPQKNAVTVDFRQGERNVPVAAKGKKKK